MDIYRNHTANNTFNYKISFDISSQFLMNEIRKTFTDQELIDLKKAIEIELDSRRREWEYILQKDINF